MFRKTPVSEEGQLHVKAKQKELHQLIIRFKDCGCRRLNELKPLKKFIFNKLNGISINDKEDVFSCILAKIFRGKFIPQEQYTFQYLRRQLLNSLRECGFRRNFRGKINRSGPIQGAVFMSELSFKDKERIG